MRHKNSMFSLPDDSGSRPKFVPAAEPLLLVDSGEPSSRRSSSIKGIPAENLAEVQKSSNEHQGLWSSVKSYPKGVFFMLGNEFCERFSFYGMRAVLTLYLIHEYQLQDSTASLLYHLFISVAYFSPLIGSIVADNYFGRYKVILWVSVVYVLGHILLSAGALPYSGEVTRKLLDIFGLALIALGTGGIKPCVSAFAADQFEEHQVHERTQFFSFFYFAINAGSLVAIIVTPLLRARLQCFGSDYCFPLAFGVPALLMAIAFFTFLAGHRYYKVKPAEKGNVLYNVAACIWTALKKRFAASLQKSELRRHWLDYAMPEHDENLISGVKSLVAVSLLFVPVVFYWALFDQLGSTWVIQARRMDGRVGSFTILPDQMNTFNAIMILLLVPIFEAFIYPTLQRFVTVTPLRKMAMGGMLAAFSFFIAGFLQVKVNSTMEPIPFPNQTFIYRLGDSSPVILSQRGLVLLPGKNIWPSGDYSLSLNSKLYNFEFDGGKAYVLGVDNENVSIEKFEYKCDKVTNGRTRIYLLAMKQELVGTALYILDENGEVNAKTTINHGQTVDIVPGMISYPDYNIIYGNCDAHYNCSNRVKIHARMGASHVLDLNNQLLTGIVRPNSVSVLWQLPQYFVMTMGEILFSVTGLEFSYSQASPSMKSVLQAIWLMTTFFGNVIDMSISGTHLIQEPAMEFFVYAALMLIVIGVFVLIAMNYTYVEEDVDVNDDNNRADIKHIDSQDNAF